MTVSERRAALLEWFYADEERSGMTSSRIADTAAYWGSGTGIEPVPTRTPLYPAKGDERYSRAYRDLCALARDGQIIRGVGRPARWWYA
jgi:hypothetical protein